MTKTTQKRLAKLIVALILTLVGLYMQMGQKKSDEAIQPGFYEVLSIADGDTITVDMEGKKEKIRFIGVDTPEVYHGGSTPPSECYADKAKAYTEASIDGKRVKLVADDKGSNRDKYGRLLRYVYNSQNIPIDEMLVSEGYGFAVDGFSYSKKQEYLSLMKDAEANKKGLWALCTIDRSKGYPEVAS
jgi:micrococcal nuclease